jgi:hypothetical protein
VPEHVVVTLVNWKPGLPDAATRRFLTLLFDPRTVERGNQEQGEAQEGEGRVP